MSYDEYDLWGAPKTGCTPVTILVLLAFGFIMTVATDLKKVFAEHAVEGYTLLAILAFFIVYGYFSKKR